MKIIFLNCYYLRLKTNIIDFFNDNIGANLFCLQEISSDNLSLLSSSTFKNFTTFFSQTQNNFEGYPNYGQLVAVNENIKITGFESIEIFKNINRNYGFLQNIDLEFNGKKYSIGNVHGMATPGHKNDTRARIKQSEIILDSYKNKDSNKIIGGDFNLNPETKSIKIFEKLGYKNLVLEYNIKTTRNEMAWSEAREKSKNRGYEYYGKQKYADYCFVDKSIKVKNLLVPEIKISDHLPLVLEL